VVEQKDWIDKEQAPVKTVMEYTDASDMNKYTAFYGISDTLLQNCYNGVLA
jgi:hypothetical protein